MRITAWKLALNVIGVLAAFVLGAGQAAAGVGCPGTTNPTFHLHFGGGDFTLVTTAPGVGTANHVDSPALSRSAANLWQEIEEWDEGYIGGTTFGCQIFAVGPVQTWLGLRNSDDQGAKFDLRAEVWFQPSNPPAPVFLLASAERYCITGLTRNPALAQVTLVGSLRTVPPAPSDGEATLKLFARMGTPQNTCGGHTSATGLRVYYDSSDRDSLFQLFLGGGT